MSSLAATTTTTTTTTTTSSSSSNLPVKKRKESFASSSVCASVNTCSGGTCSELQHRGRKDSNASSADQQASRRHSSTSQNTSTEQRWAISLARDGMVDDLLTMESLNSDELKVMGLTTTTEMATATTATENATTPPTTIKEGAASSTIGGSSSSIVVQTAEFASAEESLTPAAAPTTAPAPAPAPPTNVPLKKRKASWEMLEESLFGKRRKDSISLPSNNLEDLCRSRKGSIDESFGFEEHGLGLASLGSVCSDEHLKLQATAAITSTTMTMTTTTNTATTPQNKDGTAATPIVNGSKIGSGIGVNHASASASASASDYAAEAPMKISALDHLNALGDEASTSLPIESRTKDGSASGCASRCASGSVVPAATADTAAAAAAAPGAATIASNGSAPNGTNHAIPRPQGVRKGSHDDDENDSNADGTMASQNQRILWEAIMGVSSNAIRRERLESWGGMSDLSGAAGLDFPQHHHLHHYSSGPNNNAASATAAAATATAPAPPPPLPPLSLPTQQLPAAAAGTAATTAMQSTSFLEDLASAASSVGSGFIGVGDDNINKIPSRISWRPDRKLSTASLASETSSIALAQAEEREMSSDTIQAFVTAAMVTVGDQLAELAGVVETVAGSASSVTSDLLETRILPTTEPPSDVSSTTSTIAAEGKAAHADQHAAERPRGRARSLSTASLPISVDYDAVAAAVDAAEAATGALDLNAITANHMAAAVPNASSFSEPVARSSSSVTSPNDVLSSSGNPPANAADSVSTRPLAENKTEKDLYEMRAMARAAAGYVPPKGLKEGEVPPPAPPPKKRKPVQTTLSTCSKQPPIPYGSFCADSANKTGMTITTIVARSPAAGTTTAAGTPITSRKPPPLPTVYTTPSPASTSATAAAASSYYSNGSKASSQKWDDMYEALVAFVQRKREEETKGMSETERKEWEWDGNVPTTYKTKDGKALGRWVNNQRSAKHKGCLKRDREVRLVSAGLKWSVLTTNSWQDMMDELKLYVKEKTKDGETWDGNVPTNYSIKSTNTNEADVDDDKNLGRWINRQRSLKQAGKLKKERQMELEKIGLKWSVLSTTSWESMFETLEDYVRQRKADDPKHEWDGNVPANYKTDDSPPKALGRWINRQRSAHTKKKLKPEFVAKLNAIGLKWSVHERRTNQNYVPVSTPGSTTTQMKSLSKPLPHVPSSSGTTALGRVNPAGAATSTAVATKVASVTSGAIVNGTSTSASSCPPQPKASAVTKTSKCSPSSSTPDAVKSSASSARVATTVTRQQVTTKGVITSDSKKVYVPPNSVKVTKEPTTVNGKITSETTAPIKKTREPPVNRSQPTPGAGTANTPATKNATPTNARNQLKRPPPPPRSDTSTNNPPSSGVQKSDGTKTTN